jgi:hypothetical protein
MDLALLIGSILSSLILWVFATTGVRYYEMSQEDRETLLIKVIIHSIIVCSISSHIYTYIHHLEKKAKVVPISAVVEDSTKQ